MTDKLKLRLYRDGREVFGWVEEQDEALVSDLGKKILTLATIDTNARVAVLKSAYGPECAGDTLYLRGEEGRRNYQRFESSFDRIEQAIEACEDIKRLVAKVNAPDEDEGQDKAAVVRVL